AIGLYPDSFRERFRLRTFKENGAVVGEEGAWQEEQLCSNAVAFDPRTSTLHVLWGVFQSSYLQTYRLDLASGRVEPLQRRSVLEGFEGNSLCLRPDGREVAVWATVIEGSLDF